MPEWKDEVRKLAQQMEKAPQILPEEIPDLEIYMDQLTTYLDKRLGFYNREGESPFVTRSMVNNYSKAKLLPPPAAKRYSRVHVMLLSLVCQLKRIFTIQDLGRLLAPTGGGFSSNDYVQITVLTQGTVLGASRQLRNVYPNYLQIRYQNPALQELSLGGAERLARLPMEESYRRFYRQVMGQELSPEGCQVLRSLCQKAEESREEEML